MRPALKVRTALPGATVVLTLPKPPGVNNLFFNLRGRVPTSQYSAWKRLAAQELMIQRPCCITGPVELEIDVQEGKADLDGQAKAIIDAIVAQGIIDGDGPKTVRKITLEWAPIQGARVTIKPCEAWVQRRNLDTPVKGVAHVG